MNDTMGVSGKWIKSLIGIKKSEKPESSEKDGNVSIALSVCLFYFFCTSIPDF